jgi:hypothetical protein
MSETPRAILYFGLALSNERGIGAGRCRVPALV